MDILRGQFLHSIGLFNQVSREVANKGYQTEAVQIALKNLQSTGSLLNKYSREFLDLKDKTTIRAWSNQVESAIQRLEEIVKQKPFYQPKSSAGNQNITSPRSPPPMRQEEMTQQSSFDHTKSTVGGNQKKTSPQPHAPMRKEPVQQMRNEPLPQKPTLGQQRAAQAPNYCLEAKSMFDKHLSKDFKWADVPGDGDCFFYSVVAQYYGVEVWNDTGTGATSEAKELMLTVRRDIADYLSKHQNDEYITGLTYKQAIVTIMGRSANKYITDINNKSETQIENEIFNVHLKSLRKSSFGDEERLGQGEMIHAAVLSKMMKRPVHIYADFDAELAQNKDKQGRALPGSGLTFKGEGEPINLIYNGVNHWLHAVPKS